MEVTAKHRFARISAKKARLVTRAIAGKQVGEVLALLAHSPQRAAMIVAKVVKSAAANAENNDAVESAPEEMYVTCARVDGGPSLSRYKFGARGRIVPRLRRMSHITIELAEKVDSLSDVNDEGEE